MYNSWMKSTNGLGGKKVGRFGRVAEGGERTGKGFCKKTKGCGKSAGHKGKCTFEK